MGKKKNSGLWPDTANKAHWAQRPPLLEGGYLCRFATLLGSKHFSSRVVRGFRCSLRPAPERPWFDSEQLAILDSPFGTLSAPQLTLPHSEREEGGPRAP